MSKQTSLDRYALFYEAVGAPQIKPTTKNSSPSHQSDGASSRPAYPGPGLNQDQVDKLSDDLRSTPGLHTSHS